MATARRPAGSNLLRRGKTWYWRGALPADLVERTGYRELVVTLKTRDRDTAKRIAAAMTMARDEAVAERIEFITPEILRDLVIRERDRYLAKLDVVVASATWRPEHDPAEELKSDIMSGWAYRLIAVFGPELAFDEANVVKLKAYLRAKRAPSTLHNDIIQHYALFRREWQYSDGDSRFKSMLSDQNLVPNRINWLKLGTAVCGMRADALLDLVGRYPSLSLTEEMTSLSAETSAESATGPQEHDAADQAAAPSAAPSASDVIHGASPRQSTEPMPQHQWEALVPEADTFAAKTAAENLGNERAAHTNRTPIAMIEEIAYRRWRLTQEPADLLHDGDRAANTERFKSHRQAVRLFERLLDSRNVANVEDIVVKDIESFRSLLDDIHADWGRNIEKGQAYPTVKDLLLQAKARREMRDFKVMSAATMRKHIFNLRAALDHVRCEVPSLVNTDFGKMAPPKPKESTNMFEQPPVNGSQKHAAPEEAADFSTLPLFTGCSGPTPREMAVAGTNRYDCGLFWIPLIALYSGMRRAEIAAMPVEDAGIREGKLCFSVRRKVEGVKGVGVKTVSSWRTIPIHRELVRLGLLGYVDAIKGMGYNLLFPEFRHPIYARRDMGDTFSKQLSIVMKHCGFERPPRFLHSLRGVLNNQMKQSKVDLSVRNAILGHTETSINEVYYSDTADLDLRVEGLQTFPVVTGHLIPNERPKLLPWVEEKTPAPWFKERKKRGVRPES